MQDPSVIRALKKGLVISALIAAAYLLYRAFLNGQKNKKPFG
jgi:hypothetical protein